MYKSIGFCCLLLVAGCGKKNPAVDQPTNNNVVKVEDATIDQLNVMLQDDPANAEYLYYRGLRYMDQEDYTKAIEDFNASLLVDSTNPVTWFNRGTSKFSLDDFEGSLYDYNKAIQLKPGYTDAYFNRGVLHDTKGEFESAVADYTKVIELQPTNLDAIYYRAVDYLMLKKNHQACTEFRMLADQGYEDGTNAYQKYCVQKK